MNLKLFKLLEDLINEHGSSVILKERLLLVKDQLQKVEDENNELKNKVDNLEKENQNLKKQLQKNLVPDQFKEYMGALFKKDSSGCYTPIAHCPECKRPLWNTEPSVLPYVCSTRGCNYTIMIKEPLESIVKKLNLQDE